jgi:hypothetical protein
MNSDVKNEFKEKFQFLWLPIIKESLELINDCVLLKKYPIERANQLEKNNLDSLATFLYDEALYNLFIEKDLYKTKQSFYLSAKMELYLYLFFDNPNYFELTNNSLLCILLSDNKQLIDNYIRLTDKVHKEQSIKGFFPLFVQVALRKNWDYLQEKIDFNREHFASKKSNDWFHIDLDFFEALLNGDKKKMEESIIILATKQHKKRNDGIYRKDLISTPALTYAKLAYIKGFELDIDHPLIPKELLPVKPNDEYWEYDFMKEGKYKDV